MNTNVKSVKELRELYAAPTKTSVKKQTDQLNSTYRQWLSQSCFFVIASASENGVDCTPRGDEIGSAFYIADNKTIHIPDRRGNNRLDTLSNIIANPNVGLLFFIPGIEQTLRVTGRASVTTDTAILKRFSLGEKLPITCIVVQIEAVFFQNNRALARSALWTTDHIDTDKVPTPDEMVQSVDAR